MDTTAKYIEMCEKALEIQVVKRYQNGDIYYSYHQSKIHKKPIWYIVEQGQTGYDDLWLPHQDQLQNIAFPDSKDTVNVRVNSFANQFCFWEYFSAEAATAVFDTEEQLWLAYIMKRKYGKIWDKILKDWVKA